MVVMMVMRVEVVMIVVMMVEVLMMSGNESVVVAVIHFVNILVAKVK